MVVKKSTSVKMTSNIRYLKENGVKTTTPWNTFLWDLVPVTTGTPPLPPTTTGGYETTTGFTGCVMEPEVFLLMNRKDDLGDATRQFKRFISASNFTGGVSVDEDYRGSRRQEQEWQWLRCADYYSPGSSSSYLVNRGSGAELNGYNGTTVTMSRYPEIGSAWEYSPDVGLLKDSQTGNVAMMIKKKTIVKMTSNIRYLKENGVKTTTPWNNFLWDLVPVDFEN